MLDGYGIHTMIWDSADERLGDCLVASPADATGRGLGTRGTNQADKWVGVASRAHGARDPGTHAAGSAPGRAKNMGGCDISAVGRPFLRYNE